MSDISFVDMNTLFTEMPLPVMPIDQPEEKKAPLRWWSVNTAKDYLEVTERTVRRYIAAGKVDVKYKTVKGHRRVYLSNRSVIEIKENKMLSGMLSGISGLDCLAMLFFLISYGEKHGLL